MQPDLRGVAVSVRRWIGILAVAAVLWSGVNVPASAAILLSQLVLDVQVPAGQSQTFILEVTNTGDTPDNVTITYYDWTVDAVGNHDFILEPGLERSLRGNLEFSPASFRLESGETREVRVTVTSPADAKGTYWGMLMVENEARTAVSDVGGVGIQVQTRYGIKVYNTVPGTALPAGTIERITVRQLAEGMPPTASLEFVNTGNTKVTPKGYFEVRNAQGQTLWRAEYEGRVVLPGGRMVIERPYDGAPLPAGQYLVLGVVDYGGDRLIGGQVIMTVYE